MQKGHEMAKLLRALIGRPKGVFAFGVSTPPEAIAVQRVHAALYLGGYAASAVRGFTDHGIITETEMLQHMQYITEVATVPCIGDADDCYGGVLNVRRTVRDFLERTSLAAIHIEDQVSPKRCGHIAGKKVLPLETALGKLRAALSVRNEIDPVRIIIARTDAFGAAGFNKDERYGGDLKEAVRRGVLYARAGADLVWCEFHAADATSAEAFAEAMHHELREDFPDYPLAINISPSFQDWLTCKNPLSAENLQKWGYKLPFSTYPALQAAVHAVHEAALEFKEDYVDGIKKLRSRVTGGPAESIMKLMGVEKALLFEKEFDPEAGERQKGSDGFKV